MIAKETLLQNRYLIRRQIGRGSVGAVYQATDLRLDNDVAVKQIVRRGKQIHHAFEQEARLLARLRHLALPKVIDHFADDNGQFLVMEFIPGDDLATAALRRLDPFPLEQVIEWAIQLLHVLIYLHGQQPSIIHRDIKPHNLKLTANGEIILLDFGLARGEWPAPKAADGLTGYTSYYAAPEQILGQPADARSDLYALAATLYDLVTGVKPPDAVRHRQQALADGRPDPLQPAHEIQPTIPTAVSHVWQRAMALNPDERFASAQDMLIALQSALAAHTAVPHNLPAQYTPLIGRKAEIQAIRQRFHQDSVRLLTLTGVAGVGKTRLGLQCAAVLLENFRDGVFFVPLATLRDVSLIIASIAQALGVKEAGNKPLLQHVQEWLQDKQVLLLLDNFEHLLDAAPLVTDLLAACPQLKILVTSREALRLRGEDEFSISPLELPGRAQHLRTLELLQFTAVHLFYRRARAARADFELNDSNVTAVTDICTCLDGLPLAIELAAVYVKTLTPAQILDRLTDRFELLRGGLRDLPPRQQALQTALDWSYNLLNQEEKKLFRRLGVFAGGCTQEAVEAVCRATGEDDPELLVPEITDTLVSLVNKSLVQRQERVNGESRYTMLVTVQAYAAERLAESGETAMLKKRHAAHYLAWAEKIRPELLEAAPESPLNQFEVEHDNLRAVLQWALDNDVEAGYQLGDALWRFWQARGHYTEGRRWLEKLLAQSDTPSMARAKALSAAGNLAIDQGDFNRAIDLHEKSLALSRQLGNKRWEGVGLNNLALVWFALGNYKLATKWLEQSLALFREVANENGAGHALNNLGLLAMRQGDYPRARYCLEESRAVFQALADKRASCLPLNNLGELANYQGEHERAAALLREAHLLAGELGDNWLLAHVLANLGSVARDKGESGQAVQLLTESLKLFTELKHEGGRAALLNLLGKVAHDSGDDVQAAALSQEGLGLGREINDKGGTAVSLQNLAVISLHQEDYVSAAAQYRQALTLFSQVNHRLDMVACLEGLAGIADGQGQAERAARLLGAADVLRTGMGAPLPPVDQPGHERLLTAVRAALGEDDFAAAWVEGQAMGWETAVAYALEKA